MKELEEQLGRRPEPEELDLARAALAAAEDEKLQLRKRLQEAEKRLAGLEEEGGCFHPCLTRAGAGSGAGGMLRAQAPRGTSPPRTAPAAPHCSGVAAGEAGPGPTATEPDPRAGCTRAAAAAAATACAHCPRGVSDPPQYHCSRPPCHAVPKPCRGIVLAPSRGGGPGSFSPEGRWARWASRLAFWGRGVQLGRAFTSLLPSSPLLAIRQRKGLANLQRSKCTLGGFWCHGVGGPWQCHSGGRVPGHGEDRVSPRQRFANAAPVQAAPIHLKVSVPGPVVG